MGPYSAKGLAPMGTVPSPLSGSILGELKPGPIAKKGETTCPEKAVWGDKVEKLTMVGVVTHDALLHDLSLAQGRSRCCVELGKDHRLHSGREGNTVVSPRASGLGAA